MYPSIMKSKQLFPIKEGELKYINEFKSEFFEFGIYRAIISGTTKKFGFNPKNYYTHIDLTRAKELNLNIKLIVDSQPNFLHYSSFVDLFDNSYQFEINLKGFMLTNYLLLCLLLSWIVSFAAMC